MGGTREVMDAIRKCFLRNKLNDMKMSFLAFGIYNCNTSNISAFVFYLYGIISIKER